MNTYRKQGKKKYQNQNGKKTKYTKVNKQHQNQNLKTYKIKRSKL